MTVVPAGASAVPRQAAYPPVRAAEVALGGFGELLEERRALTDPQAGPDENAPLAVSFDRGALFGTAVALRHAGVLLASGPPSSPGSVAREAQAEGQPPAAATHSAERSPTSVSAEPVIAGVGSGEASPPAADRAASASTVVARSPAAGLEAVSERRSEAPLPQGARQHGDNPALTAGKARDAAEVWLPRGVARAETGIARRRQAAARLAPVNVVARATSAGVEIAVRIGHRLGQDDEALEGAVRRAVEAAGEALDGLRVDGREIEGSRRCR